MGYLWLPLVNFGLTQMLPRKFTCTTARSLAPSLWCWICLVWSRDGRNFLGRKKYNIDMLQSGLVLKKQTWGCSHFFYHSLRLFLMIVMDKKNVQFTQNVPGSQLYLSIGSQQLDQSPSPSDSGKLTQLTPRFWRCLRSSSLIGLRRAECWWTTWANGFPFFPVVSSLGRWHSFVTAFAGLQKKNHQHIPAHKPEQDYVLNNIILTSWDMNHTSRCPGGDFCSCPLYQFV